MQMNVKLYILFFLILTVCSVSKVSAQTLPSEHPGRSATLAYTVNGNDTTYLVFLKDLHIYPELIFRNKRQEKFYWRTVRDVKRALPYAKIVSGELLRVTALLKTIEDDRERRRFLSKYEREVFKKYEKDLRKLTINQGRLLLKLIDRETSSTSYDLIKNYRGSVSAIFWQGMARLFGSNLKSEYDAEGNDKIVERVIVLVESGQL